VTSASAADVIIYVTGEQPYAEYKGDNSNPAISTLSSLATYRSAGKKVVTILISGRPMIATDLINDSDVFIAAWLQAPRVQALAMCCLGLCSYCKLPHTWHRHCQIPLRR
jgi:beta-glucosidase